MPFVRHQRQPNNGQSGSISLDRTVHLVAQHKRARTQFLLEGFYVTGKHTVLYLYFYPVVKVKSFVFNVGENVRERENQFFKLGFVPTQVAGFTS